MVAPAFRYPIHSTSQGFEGFCREVLAHKLARPELKIYGSSGQKQQGVDIIDLSGGSGLIAIQCKLHEPGQKLPPDELSEEVAKARKFDPKISAYYLVTSAKRDTQAQKRLLSIRKYHKQKKFFEVDLLFWEDIEEILDKTPHLARLVAPQSHEAAQSYHSDALLAAAREGGLALSPDADLEQAEARLEVGEIVAVDAALQTIRKRYWDRLPARSRWRLLTAAGKAALAQGDEQRSSSCFVEALAHQPNEHDAILNAALGRLLRGERDEAYKAALTLARSPIGSAKAWARAVDYAPSDKQVRALVEEAPDFAKKTADFCSSVGHRFIEADIEEAEVWARKALKADANDSASHHTLGVLLVRGELRKRTGRLKHVAPFDKARLTEAEASFKEGARWARGWAAAIHRTEANLMLADVHDVLGNKDEVARDVEAATRDSAHTPRVQCARANLFFENGLLEPARAILEPLIADKQREDWPVTLLAHVLWRSQQEADKRRAIQLAWEIAQHEDLKATEVAIDWTQEFSGRAQAEKLLESSAWLDVVQRGAMAASIALADGDSEGALRVAKETVPHVDGDTHIQTACRLADVLASSGGLVEAFGLFRRIAVPGWEPWASRFLSLGQHLEEDGAVLEFCAESRRQGVWSPKAVQLELGMLFRYDPRLAMELARENVARNGSDSRAHLLLAELLAESGVLEADEPILRNLPKAEVANEQEGAASIALLTRAGRRSDALIYGDELTRRFPRSRRVRLACIQAWVEGAGEEIKLDQTSPGCAIVLDEEGEETTYFLAPEGRRSEFLQGEIELDTVLASRLLGRRVGDLVELSSLAPVRKAKVAAIFDGIPYRFSRGFYEYTKDFPGSDEVRRLRMGSPDGGITVEPLLEVFKQNAMRAQHAFDEYRDSMLSLHLLGRSLGVDAFVATLQAAQEERIPIKATEGSSKDFERSKAALDQANEVVIDPTAIATLALLGKLDLLARFPKPLLITWPTLHSLQAADKKPYSGARRKLGTLSYRDGSLEYNDSSPEGADEASRPHQLSAAVSPCKPTGCTRAAYLAPKQRDRLEMFFGEASLDSALLAEAPGRVFWTDDLTHGWFPQEGIKPATAWTQAVLLWLMSEKRMLPEEYEECSVRLLYYGYTFTTVNRNILRRCGSEAEWRPEKPPLREVLDYIALPQMGAENALKIGTILIADGYGEVLLPHVRHPLVHAVTDALRSRSEPGLVRRMPQYLTKIFGLRVVEANDAITEVKAWLRGRLG